MSLVLAAILIMTLSLIGGLLSLGNIGKYLTSKLDYLVSAAAGTFVFLIYHLAVESMESLGNSTGLLFILTSFIASWILFKFIPFFHHHHSGNDHSHNKGEGRKILVADGVHNIADGVLLTLAFGVSITFGWITAIGILLHESIQGISNFFVLKRSGYTTSKALLLNFCVSSTIFIGIILTNILNRLDISGYLLAIASGIFLSVVIQDLIPDTIRNAKKPGKLLPYITSFAFGILVMFLIGQLIGH